MAFLNVGDHGWMIDSKTEVDSQQEKEDAVFYATERVLKRLKEIVSIYAKFGNEAMYKSFQDAVFETMKKANYESFFNDDNYTETGQ